MTKKGYARSRPQIEAESSRFCQQNHPDRPVIEGIGMCGVPNEVFCGFMARWGYLMTNRFSDPLNGQCRGVTSQDTDQFFENVDKFAEKKNAVEINGRRYIAPWQLVNFDENGVQMDSMKGWVWVLKGQPSATTTQDNNARQSYTLTPVKRADGASSSDHTYQCV